MDKIDLFFEIRNLAVGEDLKANIIMVEDGGTGAAYLGWCENLAIDKLETLPNLDEGTLPLLVLPFADLALFTDQGNPLPAPADWRELVVRPLVIQDYLLVTLEVSPTSAPEALPISA